MQQNHHPKVWAILHVTHEDLGSFEFTLRSFGIRPIRMLAKETDIAALDPAEADLVIIMGGPMGVYEADRYKHLRDEIRLVQKRIAMAKPTLGICLGSQIMAAALGSKVYKGPSKEVGWYPINVKPDAMHGPLRHLDASEATVMHWHGDTFDLPKGTKCLASSAKYENQAFSYGEHTLGLQFHPEVTEVKLERWYVDEVCAMSEVGTCIGTLRADAHKYADKLKAQNHAFFTEWLGITAPHLLEKRQQTVAESA